MKKLTLTLIITLFLCSHALADEGEAGYGIAMRGAPKYQATDTHFEYTNPNAPKGGTLNLTTSAPFDTLNPFSIGGTPAPSLHYAYARLTARAWDEPFTLYPLIADKLEMPDDRSFITIHIDTRAKFSDGAPITADDVVFSFEVLKKNGRPNMRATYALATPAKIDAQSVRFDFKDGYTRESAMILAMMPVLQKKWWAPRDFNAPLSEIPPTSGAYKIKSRDMGKSISYVRIKDWWAADLLPARGHYNFDEINFSVVRDITTAIALVAKGDVDVRAEGDIKRWQTADYGDAEKLEIQHKRAQPARGIILNTTRAPLDDLRVRKALALLFDGDWINKTFYRSAFKRTRSIFPNTDLGGDASKEKLSLRGARRKAGALLDEAGWRIKNGVRQKDGRALSFEILVKSKRDAAIVNAYAKSLEKAGIAAKIKRADSAAFTSRLQHYDYDAVVHEWRSTLSPGTEQSVYWSCNAARTNGNFNYARICSKEIDELVAKIPQTKTRDELRAATKALDAEISRQYVWIPLFYQGADFIAVQPDIAIPAITPLYGAVIETWWMDERD